MHVKLIHALMLLTLPLLFSCSKKGGSNVKLEIRNSFAFGGPNTVGFSEGGLMIWGQSSTGKSFGQAVEDSDEINLTLDNGTWTFYAMTWDGTEDYAGNPATGVPFGGVIRCAESDPVSLSGSAASVSLVLNNGNCLNTAFGGPVGATFTGQYELPKLRLNFCDSVANINVNTQLCTDEVANVNRVHQKGVVSSYQVVMRNHTSGGLASGGIVGVCVPFVGNVTPKNGKSDSVIPNLPSGGAGFPFHMTVKMYIGSDDCDSTNARNAIDYELTSGATSVTVGSNKYFTGIGENLQYLTISPETVCRDRMTTSLGSHPFAGGTGTPVSPYIICSVPQFHAINSSSSYLADHFKLQANLDFNPYSKSFGTTAPAFPPGVLSCLESGTNFIPLGYIDGSGTCGPLNFGSPVPFTGTFQGTGFTLKNLRIRAEKIAKVGLFAELDPGVEIGNFNIENVEMSGKNDVGVVAGYAEGTVSPSSILIYDITAKNLFLEARSEGIPSLIGSIVGELTYGTLNKIIVQKSKVMGENNSVGGIIGWASSAVLTKVSAEVDVAANSTFSPTFNIGGVLGYSENTTLDFVKHEGGIYTGAKRTGGIIGFASNGTSLTNFYAISHIFTSDSDTGNQLGGVAGIWNSNGTLGKGYSLSMIRSGCPTGCTQGAITGDQPTAPGTSHSVIVLNSAAETGAGDSPVVMGIEQPASLDNMRLLATFGVLSDVGWEIINGEYPRFSFEKHPCVTPGVSGSGSGTTASPKIICNNTQYLALGSAAAGTYHRLAANIRLTNESAIANDITTMLSVLDGAGHALIAGNSTYVNGNSLGHIGTVSSTGIIKNLNIHGLSRKSINPVSLGFSHGVFAANNFGTLENMNVWSYGNFRNYGGGVVGKNMGGTMKKITHRGEITGLDFLSSLAAYNTNLITESKAAGVIKCQAANCSNFSGLVGYNGGSIKKTIMAASFMDIQTSAEASYVSMLADHNTNLIEDVVVSKFATAVINGTNAYFFTRLNAGTLRRVINQGALIYADSTVASTMTNFPVDNNLDTGTHVDVLRVGRSGKRLLYYAPFTCQGLNILRIPSWNSQSDLANWNSFLTGYGAFANSSKKLIVNFTYDSLSGEKTHQVTDFDSVNQDFTIPANDCLGSGKATLYYSDDIPVTPGSATQLAGVMLPQNLTHSNLSATWQLNAWDSSNPTHELEVKNYFSYLFGITTTPVTPRTWELDPSYGDFGMFNDHD